MRGRRGGRAAAAEEGAGAVAGEAGPAAEGGGGGAGAGEEEGGGGGEGEEGGLGEVSGDEGAGGVLAQGAAWGEELVEDLGGEAAGGDGFEGEGGAMEDEAGLAGLGLLEEAGPIDGEVVEENLDVVDPAEGSAVFFSSDAAGHELEEEGLGRGHGGGLLAEGEGKAAGDEGGFVDFWVGGDEEAPVEFAGEALRGEEGDVVGPGVERGGVGERPTDSAEGLEGEFDLRFGDHEIDVREVAGSLVGVSGGEEGEAFEEEGMDGGGGEGRDEAGGGVEEALVASPGEVVEGGEEGEVGGAEGEGVAAGVDGGEEAGLGWGSLGGELEAAPELPGAVGGGEGTGGGLEEKGGEVWRGGHFRGAGPAVGRGRRGLARRRGGGGRGGGRKGRGGRRRRARRKRGGDG